MLEWVNDAVSACCSRRKKERTAGQRFDIIVDGPNLVEYFEGTGESGALCVSSPLLPEPSIPSTSVSLNSPLDIAATQLTTMRCCNCNASSSGFCPLCRDTRFCKDCYKAAHEQQKADHWLQAYPEFRLYRRTSVVAPKKQTKKWG